MTDKPPAKPTALPVMLVAPTAPAELPPTAAEDAPPVGTVIAHLTCTTPTCTHRGQVIAIHSDTVTPVHCGGCFAVLHCDHDSVTDRVREGTIGAPVLRTTTRCTKCNTVHAETRDELPPIDLASLPAAILDQSLKPGRVK